MYQIKQKPEDFIVEEIPKLDLKKFGDYTYFLLEKTNWTTRNAIKALARRFKIKEKRFNIAGNKDKDAITKQYISVYKIGKKGLENVKIKDLKIKVIGFGNERLKLGQIEGNKFDITVRNLDRKYPKISFFPNYYDDQRFGGKNHLIGKAFVKKDFKEACDILNLNYQGKDYIGALRKLDRWLLRFYLNAYQSFLFNEVLKEYIKINYKETFEATYHLGSLIFPKGNKYVNLEIPIVNYSTVFKDKELESLYYSVLKEEGISLEDFKIPQMPELVSNTIYRQGFVKLKQVKLSYEPDDINQGMLKARFRFTLPAGCYATMAIKACFSP